MNIEIQGYTKAQLIAALFDSNRTVRFEYWVADSLGNPKGTLEISEASISFDSSASVMRTFSGRVKSSDLMNFDCIDFRITAWMCLLMPDGAEAKWSLGTFVVVPNMNMESNVKTVELSGYDLGKIINDTKSESRVYVPQNAVYTSYISQMLGEIYTNYDIEESTIQKSFPQEWEIGKSKLEIVNTLLNAINYNPLHFDEKGTAICDSYKGTNRKIDFQYIANEKSVMLDSISINSNKFDLPNKWIRYIENPDSAYLISQYTNDDPESPYSTVSRGRTILDVKSVEDIASKAELDAYTIKEANEAMQTTETIEFNTLIIPGHDYKECLWVECEEYGIADKYIEKSWEMDLINGGTMKHVCERSIQV